jgi:ribosomal protein S6
MTEGKKQYEISFLAVNEGDKDEITKALSAIDAEDWVIGKYSEMKLAYPIKKQTVAYFGFVDFMADAGKITSLDASLRFNEKILRFLIITPPPKKPTPRAERKGDNPVIESDSVVAEAEEVVKEVEPQEAEGIDNELFDQKLDEILK